MLKYLKIKFSIIILFITNIALADDNNILWLDEKTIKDWDITFEHIPWIIVSATNFVLNFAAAIAIIFVIIWAYKILLGSLEQDKTKWRDTIIMALIWFSIAILAKFIVYMVIDNFA